MYWAFSLYYINQVYVQFIREKECEPERMYNFLKSFGEQWHRPVMRCRATPPQPQPPLSDAGFTMICSRNCNNHLWLLVWLWEIFDCVAKISFIYCLRLDLGNYSLCIFSFLLLNQRKNSSTKAFACQIGKESSNFFYVFTSMNLRN